MTANLQYINCVILDVVLNINVSVPSDNPHIFNIASKNDLRIFLKKNVMKAWFFQVSSRNSISSTVAIDNMWFWLIIF